MGLPRKYWFFGLGAFLLAVAYRAFFEPPVIVATFHP
jgi:hypothetical protein